ncbi:MAG: hypothetical protein ACHQX1_01205 [Candidatus Micrarchaeales archaeon]
MIATENVDGKALSRVLGGRALLYEPRPNPVSPYQRSKKLPEEKKRELDQKFHQSVGGYTALLSGIERLDAINIPEVIDEGHYGYPLYRTSRTREFASRLARNLRKDSVIGKVVVHAGNEEAFRTWLTDTVTGRVAKQRDGAPAHEVVQLDGIKNIVLVGGQSSHITYKGPTLHRAFEIAKPILEKCGGNIGGIAIDSRHDEVNRILRKTKAGVTFFTTQIVFESRKIIELILAYDKACKDDGIKPASFLVSMAPLVREGDADFIQWLGAEIPNEPLEAMQSAKDEAEAFRRSLLNVLSIWADVVEQHDKHHITVPVGINSEQVAAPNETQSILQLKALARVIDMPGHRIREEIASIQAQQELIL